MRILAVVVTYNRCELLKQCIERLKHQETPCDILIIDNASTDDTQKYVEAERREHLFYQRMSSNIGGAGGFNAGMRWGAEKEYDRIWVMDDDSLPWPDTLSKLMEADSFLKGQYGFLASTVLWTDGSPCIMNRLHPIKRKESQKTITREMERICQATFVSCLFPLRIVKQYGLPIREFFIWGDDMEYTRRIAVRGKEPCYWVKNSVVTHAMASNNGSSIATDDLSRLERYNYAYRNENYLYRREGFSGVAFYLLRCAYHSMKVLRFAPNEKKKRLQIIWKNVRGGLSFNPPVENTLR